MLYNPKAIKNVVLDGHSLTLESFVAVSRFGATVELAPSALEAMKKSRALAEKIAAEKRVAYGITTGFGDFQKVAVSAEMSNQLSTNLILSHCTAMGEPYADEVARGMLLLRANALCVGVFPLDDEGKEFVFKAGAYQDGKDMPFDVKRVTEDVKFSWFADSTSGKPFTKGENVLEVDKKGAYSFVKAPLYNGKPMEVGPLARMWINDKPLSPIGQKFFADMFGVRAETFRQIGENPAFSIMGRNVARVEEVYQTLGMIEYWLHELEPGAQTFALPEVPQAGEGIGFTEAPRGALCHYMRVKNGVIDDYAVVAASMWNCSPRDDAGKRGAVEEALIGVPVPEVDSPVNVGRVIRAYDP